MACDPWIRTALDDDTPILTIEDVVWIDQIGLECSSCRDHLEGRSRFESNRRRRGFAKSIGRSLRNDSDRIPATTTMARMAPLFGSITIPDALLGVGAIDDLGELGLEKMLNPGVDREVEISARARPRGNEMSGISTVPRRASLSTLRSTGRPEITLS